MMTTVVPAAYLRRSYVDPNSPGDISLEAQREAVHRLAEADGHDGDVVEYSDWGISADIAKAGQRTAYARLLADIEAGRVQSVYAFDVDRLYRDPRDLIRLQDAAQAHSVRIVTTAGTLAIGESDDRAAEGFAFMGAVFGRMELQKIKKRNRAAREARMARGDRFGHPAYGWKHVRDETGRIVRVRDESIDLEPIRRAYEDTGTVLGACRKLNEDGVPSAKGGVWYTSALTRTLEENWPGLLPPKGASGKRIRSVAILSQLVTCHCGHTMTPNTHRRQMYCSRGNNNQPEHGRYNVQEAALLAAVKAEADRLQIPDKIETESTAGDKREALQGRRERIVESYIDGLISRTERDAKLAAVDRDLESLETAQTVVDVPRLDWSWPAANVNAVLRAIFERIELDADMRPVRFVWRVPEWRAPS